MLHPHMLALIAALAAILPTPFAHAAGAGFEIWLTNQATDRVLVLDGTSLKTIVEIAVGKDRAAAGAKPHTISFSPDGRLAYVANVGAKANSTNVIVIDAVTKQVVSMLPAGPGAHAVAPAPDGTRAFVANAGASHLTEIVLGEKGQFNLGRRIEIAPEPGMAASHPTCLVFSRDGAKLYVSAAGADKAHPAQSGFVAVIDVASARETARLRGFGNEVCAAVLTQDGGRIYYTDGGAVGQVGVIDVKTDAVAYHAGTPGADPHGIALAPGGNLIWIVNRGSGHLTVLNTTTSENFRNYFSVAQLPDLAAFAPDGSRVFLTLRGNPVTPLAKPDRGTEPGLAVISAKDGKVLQKIALPGDPHGIAIRTR